MGGGMGISLALQTLSIANVLSILVFCTFQDSNFNSSPPMCSERAWSGGWGGDSSSTPNIVHGDRPFDTCSVGRGLEKGMPGQGFRDGMEV